MTTSKAWANSQRIPVSHRPSYKSIQTVSAAECLELIVGVFQAHFPGRDTGFLRTAFREVQRLFEGHYPGYQACDIAYHDFAHTYVASAAVARILDGHLKSGESPSLAPRDFELAIAGILLHDTGYIKKTGDCGGTGAKYTLTHAGRSVEFAQVLLTQLAATPDEVWTVQSAIRYAGLDDDTEVPAIAARGRFIGCVVGAGDILGQMAAPDYPERLPSLYNEFREAATAAGLAGTGIGSYQSATDLMGQTRAFYQTYVQRMLTTRWGRVHEALRYHFADGRNQYLDAIAQNLDRIDQLTRSEKS